MKICDFCEEEKYSSNIKRHLKSCVWKNVIGMKKSEFMFLKNKRNLDIKDAKREELTAAELKKFLSDLNLKVSNLFTRLIVENNRDPIDKINELNVSKRTKENYCREFKLYDKWLTENKKNISKQSADSYIASLTCAASTQKRKHDMLNIILQTIIDPSIKLNAYRKRIEYKPKYAFKNEELDLYLEEQKGINFEDYVLQKFLSAYGLRINTAASLKVSHLIFLKAKKKEDKKIVLPDSKVKRRREEPVESDLENDFKKLITGKEKDDYVFYSSGSKFDEFRRARDLSEKINKHLRDSKVIEHDENYKYSSHCFRRSVAFNLYNKENAELKEKVRKAIGQSQNSTAVEFYIN